MAAASYDPTVLFWCPRCGMASANPNDLAEGYCGACHDWTGKEPVRYLRLTGWGHALSEVGQALVDAGDIQDVTVVDTRSLLYMTATIGLPTSPDTQLTVRNAAWKELTRQLKLGAGVLVLDDPSPAAV